MAHNPTPGKTGKVALRVEHQSHRSKPHRRVNLEKISSSIDNANQMVDGVEEVGFKIIKLTAKVAALLLLFGLFLYVVLHHMLNALGGGK